MSCSGNCRQGKCDITSGSCTLGCRDGWYGEFCNISCEGNCRSCNISDGDCLFCDDNYWGVNCTRQCPVNCYLCNKVNGTCQSCKIGFFGINCTKTCAENCAVCNQTTGDCFYCKVGFYGENCSKTCDNCKNNFCPSITGECVFGCKEGWFGNKCDARCFNNCASCENNATCSYCVDGWGGENCDVKCLDTCVSCSLGKYCDQCTAGNKIPSFNCTCNDQKCTKFENNVCTECEAGTGWFNLFDTCCPCLHCLGGAEKCSPKGVCEDGCEPGYYLKPFGCVERCDIPNCVWCEQRHREVPNVICIGCKDGFYVENKTCSACSDHCAGQNNECHNVTGHCLNGCDNGWTGELCNIPVETVCDGYLYNGSCIPCSATCLGNVCDHSTGDCIYGCKVGWYSDKCSKQCNANCYSCNSTDGSCLSCSPGKWGHNCTETCAENCTVCSLENGECLYCKPGFYGVNCTQRCVNCKNEFCISPSGECVFGCKEGWFGSKCNSKCFNNCASCQDNVTCSYCFDGWGGENCDTKCPDTCVSCNLGKYCGQCKAGNKIPSFNCTCNDKKCIKFGTKNNETVCTECEAGTGWFNLFDTCCPCLHCLGGAEKCSPKGVCEDGCEPGYYLKPFGCVERCDIPNCVWCEQRHREVPNVICIGCKDGFYVENKTCSACSDHCAGQNNECHNVTGHCLNGCDNGWTGELCNIPVETVCDGYLYNGSCIPCSATCLGNVCDHSTGDCIYGCKVGWYSDKCSKQCNANCYSCNSTDGSCLSCSPGKWGHNCTETCAENCTVCSLENGECLYCKPGFYGVNCTQRCVNCKNEFCISPSGECVFGCKEGWFGSKCDSKCFNNCASCQDNVTCSYCFDGWGGENCDTKCPDTCVSCNLGKYCGQCKAGNKIPSFNCTCNDKKCIKFGTKNNETVCTECEAGTGWYNLFDTCCPCLHCLGGAEKCSPKGVCEDGCEPGYYLKPFGCVERCDIPNCVWCEQRHREVPNVICIGCKDGFYVENKTCSACSDHCAGQNNECHNVTGHCLNGCDNGWTGELCNIPVETVCDGYLYNGSCIPCSATCLGNVCDHSTGDCIYGCKVGWYSDKCSKQCNANCYSCNSTDGSCLSCSLGKWGHNCTETCAENCTVCSLENGECLYCKPGFYGENCSESCMNCKNKFCLSPSGECVFGCKEGWFGNKCDSKCLNNCASCENNATCSYCVDGWGGENCDVKCPDTCVSCSLGKYCDQCTAGNKIPSFNCTCNDQKCTKFENNVCTECEAGTGWFNLFDTCCPCLHCLGGAEKCSPKGVCEDGCEPGYYLKPFGCVERCDIPNCVWCEQRHREVPNVICIGCKDGFYVENKTCSACSGHCAGQNNRCHNGTGHCLNGCDSGWTGELCNISDNDRCLRYNNSTGKCEKCLTGSWGPYCKFDCSNTCVTCDITSGNCTSCAGNRFGLNCAQFCSTKCIVNEKSEMSSCNFNTGECLHGCQGGWFGNSCNCSCANDVSRYGCTDDERVCSGKIKINKKKELIA
ncbi:hypothetical protein KUTeg_000924 [Tegillarca granosa]|uniref:EGF-like domain-containing protein n=1 Tax=Tegillarca granosa TaxID=220873 RepID=A0ABQ9FXI4_TEGGR|nr:hypothetical protein KUTeg_000924 [Tegillarca granosa]